MYAIRSYYAKANGEISYDYLVVATGLAYNYAGIEGMTEELVGQKGISSVYLNDPVAGTARGGVATGQWFKDMRKAAESASPEKPIKVICTQPDTPIKCGGAPQKILYLSDDNLRGNGPDGGADVRITSYNVCYTKLLRGVMIISIKFISALGVISS